MSDGDASAPIFVPPGRLGSDREDTRHQEALAAFAGDAYPVWVKACRRLAGAGYGGAIAEDYVRLSPAIARIAGPRATLDLVSVVSGLAIRAGRDAAARFMPANPGGQ